MWQQEDRRRRAAEPPDGGRVRRETGRRLTEDFDVAEGVEVATEPGDCHGLG